MSKETYICEKRPLQPVEVSSATHCNVLQRVATPCDALQHMEKDLYNRPISFLINTCDILLDTNK